MEPVTHLLTGACLSRAGLNRKTALATVTLVLAAEAPDIDVLGNLRGPVYGFAHHRGITHTLVGTPFVAALVLGVVYLLYRLMKRRRPEPAGAEGSSAVAHLGPPAQPRWGVLYGFACLSVLVHILLDFTNNYGVRPFEPFSYRWYSWDIVFIFEPLLYVFLLGGLLLPGLFGLINDEIGGRRPRSKGRTGAILALAAMVALWGLRDYEHRRALAAMESLMYQDEEPIRVSAYPYYVNPFKWYGVAETRDFYEQVLVDSLTPEVNPGGEGQVRYKPEESDVTEAAKNTYLGHVYLDWAQYPVVEAEPVREPLQGYLVTFTDLRYQYPEMRRGRAALGASLLLNAKLQPVDVWFELQRQRPDLPMPGGNNGGSAK